MEATEALAERLGRHLSAGAVVALIGDLGAGKTAFARGVACGLDVADPLTSPTFTLMQEYEGRVPLYHFDAWMDGREALFLEGGGADYLGGGGVALVEWADRVEGYLPAPRLEVRLEHRGEAQRAIELGLVPGTPESVCVALRGAARAALEALENRHGS